MAGVAVSDGPLTQQIASLKDDLSKERSRTKQLIALFQFDPTTVKEVDFLNRIYKAFNSPSL